MREGDADFVWVAANAGLDREACDEYEGGERDERGLERRVVHVKIEAATSRSTRCFVRMAAAHDVPGPGRPSSLKARARSDRPDKSAAHLRARIAV